jgi:predicted anti-sigma-YlaC factor YlaD
MNIVNIEDGYCRRIRSYLDSYLNNELLVETTYEVVKHMEICDSCSRSLRDRARLKDQLKSAVMRDYAPVALRERINDNLRAGRRFKLSTLTIVMAAAALLVIALSVPFVFKSGRGFEAANAARLPSSRRTPLSLPGPRVHSPDHAQPER